MHFLKHPRAKLVAAMVLFGTLGPFVRHIPVSSGELALYRAVMAAILLGVVLLCTGQGLFPAHSRREIPLLLASGAALGLNWALLFEAYKYTTVSTATLSYYFAPVLVTLACPLLFKEKLTRRQVLCFAFSTLGLVLITGAGLSGRGKDAIGILFGLGAAVLYATVILLNKRLHTTGLHRTFLQFLAAAAVLLPYVALSGGCTLGGLPPAGWLNLLVVGLVHTGLTYCLYFSSLKELPGQEAAILSYVDPLVAVVVSVALLQEPMIPLQLVGGLLILGFTLWNETAPNEKAAN